MLHAFGDLGLSRGGSFVRLLPVQEVGELRGRMCRKAWVPQTPAGKPFSMKDFSEQEVLGASTPTVGQTNLSQWRREVGTEDLRTCWIDADETGSRLKSWRDVVLESTQETFPDSIVSGPATALTVCRQMFQTRGDPKEMVRQVGQGTVCRA